MTQDLSKLSLCDAQAGLIAKKFSATELTQACIKRAHETEQLNVFITPLFDQALAQAKESDVRIHNGTMGSMEGLPIGIKDLFCTKGIRTTAASKILGNFIPPYESTITQKLLSAGAVFTGKLNLDEFAMGSANLTSAFGPVISPLKANNNNKTYVPGGSSGGSSATVLAGSSLAATGTDTGGSIRQPAAFCGLVGLKPTYGLCSRYGVIAFASSLDQAGPITRTVKDAALMLKVMAGHDSRDSTSLNVAIPDYVSTINQSIKGLKIGIPQEYQVDGLNSEISTLWQQGISWLKEAGAEIIDVSLPHTKYALPTYYIIAPAEASSNLARYDGIRYTQRATGVTDINSLYEKSRGQGFGNEVKRRILIGTYVLSAGYYDAYYIKAHKVKRLIAQDFMDAYTKVDLILAPTTPTPAFAFGEEPKDPVSMYMNDILTVPANLAGLPAISVPAGRASNGLPLGLQLIAPPLQEERMIQAAYTLEQAANFQNQLDY